MEVKERQKTAKAWHGNIYHATGTQGGHGGEVANYKCVLTKCESQFLTSQAEYS